VFGMGIQANSQNIVDILDGAAHTGRLLFLDAKNLNNTNSVFEVNNKGTGTLIRAWTNRILGTGKYVAHFSTNNTQSNTFTMQVETNGKYGPILGVTTGSGFGSVFMSTGSNPKSSALYGNNYGGGNGITGYSNIGT